MRIWNQGAISVLTFLVLARFALAAADPTPHTLWLEAESFGPLKGSNFSFQPLEQTTKGSWAVSGPGVAAEWTQGGESEWMSVGARFDEPGEIVISREAEAPAAGAYTLWVRYADYRGKKETFGVRVKQGEKVTSHVFGEKPVVDELDQMKVLWDWAFGWDHISVDLQKGPVRVELFTTGPTEARRQVDCIGLTTDQSYQPFGREKPDSPVWKTLRALQEGRKGAKNEDLKISNLKFEIPREWKIASAPPVFLWNTGQPWLDELKKPADRMEWPFACDPPLLKDFLAAYTGKELPVFGSKLSGPSWHIPLYPATLGEAPFMDWMAKHADRRFAILLNYGDPTWPKDVKPEAVYANLQKLSDRFVGYVAGENISYDNVDQKALNAKISAAASRGEILAALREAHTAATIKKFSDYAGVQLTAEQAWGPDISCLSANVEAHAHAICAWGAKRIGHESSGNAPTLARRLAFLRGAARQFGAKIVDYQSCNLGDASNIFSREAYLYPASSRYILDNQYDAWAGSGMNWVLKDYFLFHLAGADAFYHEEGQDIFWKPGGNSAGDGFPVQLSPRGRVTEAVIKLAESHPRGTQFTPVAFLLDEAHGYSQEMYQPGAFGLDPQLNPAALTPGIHFDSIRAWFDVAYYPAPETQNDPATAIRQVFINGIFGDIFDVLVTAPKKGEIVSTYPLLIAAGQVNVTEEWGATLAKYIEQGGTLVVCADQLSGPGVKALQLPQGGADAEAANIVWTNGGASVASNVFRYHAIDAKAGTVLASTEDGKPLCVSLPRGKGRLIFIPIPMGLGIDHRPTPLLALLMQNLTEPLVPIRVSGDVEWTLNILDDGSWAVGLLNNSGVNKPQHGVNPTDLSQKRDVRITIPFKVVSATEWMTNTPVKSEAGDQNLTTIKLTVPAGAVRLVNIQKAP